jgi:hypothetical protein
MFGKICTHLAAGGAPVAVKRRAVEPVNKIKIHPVHQLAQGKQNLELP